MSALTGLALVGLLLALNAFFVGAEFALVSTRRTEIEPLAEGGSRAARVTLGGMERVSLMMAGAQLGITVCTVGLGALGEPAVAHLIAPGFAALGLPEALVHPAALVLATVLIVYLHVVVGEMVPKNIAIARPDRSALLFGPPLVGAVTVLKPAIAALNLLANGSLRLVGVQPRDEVASVFTQDEVAGLIAQSRREGLLGDEEHHLLAGALTLGGGQVDRVLLAADTLVTVPPEVTGAQVEELAARTGFSRFPVRTPAGDLTGYLHLKDVLEPDPGRRGQPVAPRWLRPLPPISAATPLRSALRVMQSSGTHLARVTDTGGAVLGVVALEDIIEELVGEIRDGTRPNPT